MASKRTSIPMPIFVFRIAVIETETQIGKSSFLSTFNLQHLQKINLNMEKELRSKGGRYGRPYVTFYINYNDVD